MPISEPAAVRPDAAALGIEADSAVPRGESTGGPLPGANTPRGSLSPTPSFRGSLPANPSGLTEATLELDGVERKLVVYRPANSAPSAPLVLLYHGTGMAPDVFVSWLDAISVADRRGFILVAPAARTDRMGGPSDPDHWERQPYPTGWNLSDQNPNTNDDVRLTRAIIASAAGTYGIDQRRVYALGFSNGGYFAPFVSLLLNEQIAGFAESAGGAIRCENRGKVGEQWIGHSTTCAELAKEPGYPKCDGPLKPTEVPVGRIPAGYLTHYNDDTTSSVAWTCTLAAALKQQATTRILSGRGHDMPQGFLDDAWSHLSRHTLPQ